MPRIKDTSVEAVKNAADIVALVEARTRLRKVGGRFTGLCPFHQEKTPSFSVSPDRGTYHCFGCGVGGDAISFVQETEGVDFVGTKRFRYGLGRSVERRLQVTGIDLQKALKGAEEPILVSRKSALTRPGGQFCTRREASSAQNLLNVIDGGTLTDHEFGGDLLIRIPARHKRSDVPLAGSECFAAQLTFDMSDARHLRRP